MNKDINFFELVELDKKKDRTQSFAHKLLLSGGACLAVVVFCVMAANYFGQLAAYQVDVTQRLIDSAVTPEELVKIREDSARLALIETMLGDIGTVTAAYESEVRLSTGVLDSIAALQPAAVRIRGIGYTTGALVLDCRAKHALSGAEFANTLREIPGITAVDYAGASGYDGNYVFTITLTLPQPIRPEDAILILEKTAESEEPGNEAS